MGLLSDFGKGLAYGSDEQVQNRADDREFSNYEKKLKLAQDMQLKLEERKMQLSQQFPKLMQVQGDYGVITGIFNDGSTKELSRDPEARQAELDKTASTVEANKALSEYRGANATQLIPAKAAAEPIKAGAAATNAAANTIRAENSTAEKPMTEAQQRANISRATTQVLKEAQDNYEDDLSEEEIQARVAAKLAQQTALLEPVAGVSAPTSAGVGEPSNNSFAKYHKQ